MIPSMKLRSYPGKCVFSAWRAKYMGKSSTRVVACKQEKEIRHRLVALPLLVEVLVNGQASRADGPNAVLKEEPVVVLLNDTDERQHLRHGDEAQHDSLLAFPEPALCMPGR